MRLHIAQADDALADICRLRQLITGLTNFKKLNVSGTGNKPNTRMRTLHTRMMNKIDRTANSYIATSTALLSLDPTGGDWKDQLCELDKKKIFVAQEGILTILHQKDDTRFLGFGLFFALLTILLMSQRKH